MCMHVNVCTHGVERLQPPGDDPALVAQCTMAKKQSVAVIHPLHHHAETRTTQCH